MKGKRIVLVMLVLLLGFALIFSGCKKEEKAAEKEAKETEEAVPSSYTDNAYTKGEDFSGKTVNVFGAFVDEDAKRFEKSMVPFEEETGMEVEYEGSGDFESLIAVRTEGGDPPDIAVFPQPGLMADMVDRGFVIDLNGHIEMSYLKEHYHEDWMTLATVGDTLAGVWYRASVKSLVWYAKPIFEEEGYEIPTSWDELLALSDQMVADGYTPWSIGIESSGATGWVATDWMEDIMLRTASPEKYDQWVTGQLGFNSPEVKNAAETMGKIWFNEDYVLGGVNSILTVPFGDAATPLVQDPPKALMHRQASFITAFFPDDTNIGEEVDYFYFPEIDPQFGEPVLVAGDCFSAMTDKPETLAVIRWLATPESTKGWLQSGGFVAPHKDTPLDWYPSELDRRYAEILINADTVRFDGSDLMPGSVGAGSFWKGMVNLVRKRGENLEDVMKNIDQSWPE